MRHLHLAPLIIATIALGACGSSKGSTTATTTKSASTGTSTTVRSSGSSTTAKASGSSTTAKSSGTATTKPAVAVAVDLGTTSLGKVLVDAQGHTLYRYQKDVAGKSSSCAAACATAWPPVTSSAAPVAGTGVTAAKLGTITRADGSKQITYYGWPLYRHATDVKAGDVTGEKVDAAWFAVNAAGTAVGG